MSIALPLSYTVLSADAVILNSLPLKYFILSNAILQEMQFRHNPRRVVVCCIFVGRDGINLLQKSNAPAYRKVCKKGVFSALLQTRPHSV